MTGLLKILTIALSVAGVVMLVMGLGRSLQVRSVRRRLMLRLQAGPLPQLGKLVTSRTGTGRASSVINMLSRLSLPQTGWRDSEMLLRFIRAGFRQPHAPRVYFAVKTGMILGVFLSVALLMPILSPHASWSQWLITMLSLALFANFLPDLYLRIRTSERAQRMQDALPDIIDLLVICTESGLGMDAAIGKVARDMARSSPDLSEEFYIMSLEIRAGEARMVALRNLATRVHLEDVYDLASMLIQADRFGTSLAVSLRIQSEVMRGKRMQRAEEIAAKVPTKMLLPLVLFIFPVLLMVLLGPAVIQIGKAFAN